MRYKVTVVELLPRVAVVEGDSSDVEGNPLFVTTIEHKPDLGKLVEALKAPRVRVRASRAKA